MDSLADLLFTEEDLCESGESVQDYEEYRDNFIKLISSQNE